MSKLKEFESRRLLDLILDEGVNLNWRDRCGSTPLLLLCRFYKGENLFSLIEAIIARKCTDINARNKSNWNALVLVCFYYPGPKMFEIVSLLIESGIDVNAATAFYNWNALFALVCNKKGKWPSFLQIVRVLVERGLNMNARSGEANAFICLFGFDRSGSNHYSRSDFLDVVRFFIANGSDVDVIDCVGRNAIHLVCEKYNGPNLFLIVKLLVEAKIKNRIKSVELLKKRGFKQSSKMIQLVLHS